MLAKKITAMHPSSQIYRTIKVVMVVIDVQGVPMKQVLSKANAAKRT